MSCDRIELPTSRREFLQRAGCGFGAVALAALTRSPLLAQGERVVVSLDVSVDDLASWDDDGRLRVLPGLYTLSVGADASSDVLRVGLSVSEEDAAAGNACLSAVYAL